MSWNIGDNRNLFLKLETELGLYHVVLTTPKTSPEKLTMTVAEMQQFPYIEKTDSKKKSCLKWTIYNSRRKVCVNFQTEIDKVNIVFYRFLFLMIWLWYDYDKLFAVFYDIKVMYAEVVSKGLENCRLLTRLLGQNEETLDDYGCPKIQDLVGEGKANILWICSICTLRHKTRLHCADRKAKVYGERAIQHL